MVVPKKKRIRSAKNIRKACYWAKTKKPTLTTCPQCKKLIKPHHVCPYCGTYKKVQVIDIEAKEKKKEEKRKKREEEAKEETTKERAEEKESH